MQKSTFVSSRLDRISFEKGLNMSDGEYLTADNLITTLPCTLYSVIVTGEAQAVATVTLYDGQRAETGYEIAVLRSPSGGTLQVRFEGLKLTRGLYVDVDANTTCCVIEWEPVGYPRKGEVEYDDTNVTVP